MRHADAPDLGGQRPGDRGDDADARGDHVYPDGPPPVTRPAADKPDPTLTREAGQYVAGADGTQEITTPDDDP